MLKNRYIYIYTIFLLGLSACVVTDSQASSCSSSCSSDISKNLWQPHAFSNYASQEILIMKNLDLDAEDNSWLNRFGMVTEYMQSFGKKCAGLGALPFWSGTNTMTIGNNDGASDLDAYQFGLGNVITPGSITLQPKVQHVGAELMWYGMQNNDKAGFYAKIKAPLGAMMVSSNLCEKPATLDINNNFIPYYPIPQNQYATLSQALYGGTYENCLILAYGKVACNKQTVIRFGDIAAAAGVNFIAKEEALFGVGAKVSMPTGNVPIAEYMLEPIFGRAGHWGLGGEIQGQYTYYFEDKGCWKDRSVRVWAQGELMHLFSGRKPSWRSFDLAANGKGSKYLLLQRWVYEPSMFDPVLGAALLTAQEIIPAINITTLPVSSTFAIEGNFALMVDFKSNDWNLGICGEVWGRSQERLEIPCCSPLQDRNNFDADYDLSHYVVIGRQASSFNGNVGFCEPLAKINQSQPAFDGIGIAPAGVVLATNMANHIPASYTQALDICGAQAASIITGKVLAELGYTWSEECNVPHVSVFGAAEMSASRKGMPNLWSVGIQASFQF